MPERGGGGGAQAERADLHPEHGGGGAPADSVHPLAHDQRNTKTSGYRSNHISHTNILSIKQHKVDSYISIATYVRRKISINQTPFANQNLKGRKISMQFT